MRGGGGGGGLVVRTLVRNDGDPASNFSTTIGE